MADVVTSQILENGPRRIIAKFTNFSDATGETAVQKVDATSTGPYGVISAGHTYYPGVHLKISGIWYACSNMSVRVQWVATTATDAIILAGYGDIQFLHRSRGGFQGLTNPNNPGATGSIQFTTAGQVAGSSYTIILDMIKGNGPS